jgi:hypothetical protein
MDRTYGVYEMGGDGNFRRLNKMFHTTTSNEHSYDGPYMLENQSHIVHYDDQYPMRVYRRPAPRDRSPQINRRRRDLGKKPLWVTEGYKNVPGTFGTEYYKNVPTVFGSEYMGEKQNSGTCNIL